MKALTALLAAFALVACTTPPRLPPPGAEQARCVALFEHVDAAIEREGVRDAMTSAIRGFPYLRVDRLLASFRDDLDDAGAMAFWLERLARADAEARAVELANLASATRTALDAAYGEDVAAALDRCRASLVGADIVHPARLAALQQIAVVPDDYSLALRTLGLYPLARIPFYAGVRVFERKIERIFELPLETLPVRGRVTRFAPAPAAPLPRQVQAQRIGAAAAANPLAIPYLDSASLREFAHAHAPVFDVDVHDDNDRIGQPYWPPHGLPQIDIDRPVVFYRQAHARVAGQVLLQLVYTAWFPARPRTSRFDLLGGHLDALIWRVTLAPDGEPLVFDSIHACGCYHFSFPTPRVRARPAPRSLEEWLFVPQALPQPPVDHRVVLRVATRTHYLQTISFEPASLVTPSAYTLVDDDTLRSLPAAGGRRSLFGADALIAGTERPERFVFWPMGIKSAGAMRQWGRHATAFVGRRHFDDPFLIEERFEIGAPRGSPF